MKWLPAIVLSVLLSTNSFAFTLSGAVNDNGDGTYSLSGETPQGVIYTGIGQDEGDGTLKVRIKDANGTSYAGTATQDDKGGYYLNVEKVK